MNNEMDEAAGEGNNCGSTRQTDEMKQKLYAVLIDQLTKYNTIIWQFPAALFAANTLALDKAAGNPLMIGLLAIVNIPFAYAFQRLVRAQNILIDSVREAESKLKEKVTGFIPDFPRRGSCVRATSPMVILLWLYPFALFSYFAFAISRC